MWFYREWSDLMKISAVSTNIFPQNKLFQNTFLNYQLKHQSDSNIAGKAIFTQVADYEDEVYIKGICMFRRLGLSRLSLTGYRSTLLRSYGFSAAD